MMTNREEKVQQNSCLRQTSLNYTDKNTEIYNVRLWLNKEFEGYLALGL